MTHHAKVIAGGKIVIPANLRRQLNINDGDSVVLDVDAAGTLAIRTYDQILREGQRRIRAELTSPISVAKFLADRRAEAANE